MKALLFIETDEKKVLGGSLELISAVKALDAEGTALVVGNRAAADTVSALGVPVIFTDNATDCDTLTEVLSETVKEQNPDIVLLANTALAKDIAPRIAARIDLGCVSDVTGISKANDKVIYTRPAYGGTILEHIEVEGASVVTLRNGSFPKPEADSNAGVTEKKIEIPDDAVKAKIVDTVKELSESVNLEEAQVIVSGGRGMGSAENFKLVEELANVLGGVVGATRPVIEDGWISRAHQVGQSGKVVAPKLYIACGLSGATQHTSGMSGSNYIVAINKDEEAPIFEISDISIVGNAVDILPVMIEEMKKAKAK
ncbi:electron transfer flavoprotein subunit alpha/FixB family protein [Clostridium tyrobutyricum]|jgi:electron transfer flavoprotein alpha subunit|uniref:electron transfer flavoprotein subunit alpha/FixB family protein n=2 Tax=Clostridium TaxID=1485 RepID=UPI0003030EB1|nr:electron transfer flavoprotein subunit alpha/FixB family protein [Clostridium tyrobutyricum]MBR9648204.1 electron transfer flavoprotein subunit alpha/FixB family protein [Clostridium tyrobutyricum]MBV4414620.1 electron transfer flavoprotein subunit alpha/FixB family protein [Clostridium tyrobutyricum]MBV4422633.1 electron transfer flavoprotein subunit alpha/FixB family protein [Clostridium tyrobutyricum]MBV4426043.1 electron transfer flavoprotein subunit alpha/FixB family protein [Clostridiu